MEKRARSDAGLVPGEQQSALEGAPQGSWKLLAALRVCFLEGDLFVGVFIGTCEEMSLESNVCGLCGAVCVGSPRVVVYEHRADRCPSWADRIA